MSLRIDPALPILWRTPDSLQIGAGGRVVIESVTPAEERIIGVLAAGTSHTGLRMYARSARLSLDELDQLLGRLEPVLLDGPAAAPPRVAVTGRNEVATELARHLEDAGSRVGVDDEPDIVVVVSDHIASPADHGHWLMRDVPHLSVAVSAERVEVGPLVVPGGGACLYCVQLARRDADPAWPALATQLAALPPVFLPRTAVAEAAARAARRVAAAGPIPDVGDGLVEIMSVEDGSISAWRVARHPACLCSAEPGSDWARGDAPAAPDAPSSSPSSAVPA